MKDDDPRARSRHPAHVPRYVISVVSRLVDMPAPTLRAYDRLGLLSPARTAGGMRLYSDADVLLIRRIVDLTRQGVNLAGVKVILELEATRSLHSLHSLRSEQRDERGVTVTQTRALIKLRTEIVPKE